MPIYEFKCNECSKEFEELLSRSEEVSVSCPVCKSNNTTKLMSASAVGRSAQGVPSCGSSCPGSAGCSGGGCQFS